MILKCEEKCHAEHYTLRILVGMQGDIDDLIREHKLT